MTLLPVLALGIATAVGDPGNVLNAQAFGAKGDGRSDDTKALQSALDTAGSDPGAGRTVFLPSGKYRITEPLSLPPNVSIQGHGIGFSSTLLPERCDGVHVIGRPQHKGFTFRNKITGLTIDMRNGLGGSAAIRLNNAYTIKLSELFLFQVGTGIAIDSARHVTLDHLSIYGSDRGHSTGVSILDGIVSAYNVNVESVNVGLLVRESGEDRSAVSLFGGYFERFGTAAVVLEGVSNTTIVGTVVRSQTDRKQVPVVIRAGTSASGRCGGNSIVGGAYLFEDGSRARAAFEIAKECPDNVTPGHGGR